MAALHCNCPYMVEYACEKVASKQRWINDVMHRRQGMPLAAGSKDGRPCVYDNICDMSVGASCMVHGQRCEVKAVHVLIAGWSCKDLSRLSADFIKKKNSNVLQEKRGSSGETLDGLLRFLRTDAPPVYVGENVDEIVDLQSESRQYLFKAMFEAGYVMDVAKVDSSEYGHWTKRTRAYTVAFHCRQCQLTVKEAAALCKHVIATIESLKLPRASQEDFCLANDDPYVLQDLKRQVSNQEAEKKRGGKQDTAWQAGLLSLCHTRGIRWVDCMLPPEDQNEFFKALPKRMQMSLGYNLNVHPQATSVDICQSADRAFTGHEDVLTCLTPASRPYIVDLSRVLTGMECLIAQGFPKQFFTESGAMIGAASFSDSFMRDLAGKSFCSSSFMAVLLAVLVHWPPAAARGADHFDEQHDEGSASDEEEQVMEILGLIWVSQTLARSTAPSASCE